MNSGGQVDKLKHTQYKTLSKKTNGQFRVVDNKVSNLNSILFSYLCEILGETKILIKDTDKDTKNGTIPFMVPEKTEYVGIGAY